MKKIIKRTITTVIMIFICLCLKAEQSTDVVKSTEEYNNSESSVTIIDLDISSDVPVYEYVPKVIIQGKWGNKPGEFGREGEADVMDLKPESMAVDSKGNIYILDFVNNRIQKFDSEGRYLKSIEVDGLRGPIYAWEFPYYNERMKEEIRRVKDGPEKPKGIPDDELIPYIWPPEVQGINIVIDSNDTLYYYLVRYEYDKDGNKTKETGEVWEFKDDKLVRKYVIGLDKIPEKLKFIEVAYHEIKLFIEEPKEVQVKEIKRGLKEIIIKHNDKVFNIKVSAKRELKGKEIFWVGSPKIQKKHIFLNMGVYDGEHKEGEFTILGSKVEERSCIYSIDGKLEGYLRGDNSPFNAEDTEGNYYNMEVNNDGIIVKRSEMVRISK